MLATCNECGMNIIRYGSDKEMSAPCSNCGSFIMKILHFTVRKDFCMGYHEFVMNINTKEILTPDLCDLELETKI